MYLRHLSVADFRSWPAVDLSLDPGPTVLVGRNGAGKTNLIEAIGYLSTLGSHRVSADAPLIRRGSDRAIVRAAAVSGDRELRLEVDIGAGRANKATINRSPQRSPREILGIVRSVLFAPEDVILVRGDPGDRRRFLDQLVIMRTPRLAAVRSEYDKILRQRSTLLKSAGSARRSGSQLATLDIWDEHLAAAGSQLLAARLALVDDLAPRVAEAYRQIAPESAAATIDYRWSLADDADIEVRDPVELAELLRGEMQRRRSAELDRGVCLVGPHRDDLGIDLAGGPAKGFASHGETWSLALALRLASFELLRSDDLEPILLLDDVFAELDTARRDTLAEIAGRAEQTLITAAVAADVPESLAGMTLFVADGRIDTSNRSMEAVWP